MTSSLMDQFKGLAEDYKNVELLFDTAINYDYDNLEITLYDLINRIIHDKNLFLETGIQELTPEEFQKTKENRGQNRETVEETAPPPQHDDLNLAEGSVVLPIKAIVAPVRGKAIYELKIGDKIMVRILPNSERANYFIDLLDLRIEGHIKSIPCEVIDIKAKTRDDPIEILTEIGPGIYGKCLEDERQVKLRIYNPSVDGSISKASWDSKKRAIHPEKEIKGEESGLSKTTYIIMGLFALIVLIFLFLIYLSL